MLYFKHQLLFGHLLANVATCFINVQYTYGWCMFQKYLKINKTQKLKKARIIVKYYNK